MTGPQLQQKSALRQHAKQHAKQIEAAKEYCAAKSVRLTKLRKQVLELLWACPQPMTAYSLIDALAKRNGRPVAPPTIYRALGFLEAQSLIAKIQSMNAFVPCTNPKREHDLIFLLCDDCGHSFELEDARVEQQLTKDAAELGFSSSRSVVEVKGTCASCRREG